MKTIIASMELYTNFVDRSMLNAIANGITQFNELVLALRGVYPMTALDCLERLVLMGRVPVSILARAMRQVEQRGT
jgi:hypothetical protein